MHINERVENLKFTRRALFALGAKASLLSLLAGKLYYLQIINGEKYLTLSEKNRIKTLPLFPERGLILDRNGETLAGNKEYFSLIINRDSEEEITRNIENLNRILKDVNIKKEDIFEKIQKKPEKYQFLVSSDIKWQNVAKIEVNKQNLPLFKVKQEHIRYYPLANNLCHIIGYVKEHDKLNQNDAKNIKTFSDKVGITGIEKEYDKFLQGKSGVKNVEVDAKNRIIREINRITPKPGNKIQLTIDANLQNFLVEQLKNNGGIKTEGGSAVVVDIKNGDILAMESVPNFNPNKFITGISNEEYQYIIRNPDSPFSNKSISSTYSPGSTFKLITALAALEKNIINERTTFRCKGHVSLGDRKFNCWKRRGHGKINLTSAIAQSCNVFFYEIAMRLDVEDIAKMARKFGFGKKTGIKIAQEAKGLVPDKKWKFQKIGKPWYDGETLNTSIGQGYLSATPIQMAMMMAKIISNNKALKPNLIKRESGAKIKKEPLDIKNKYFLNLLKRGMVDAANIRHGTLYRYKIDDLNFAFAGKTGTVQVVSRTKGKTPEELKRSKQNHSLFVGYAPFINPKYAISVVIEHGGSGSEVAGRIGKEILLKAQEFVG